MPRSHLLSYASSQLYPPHTTAAQDESADTRVSERLWERKGGTVCITSHDSMARPRLGAGLLAWDLWLSLPDHGPQMWPVAAAFSSVTKALPLPVPDP